MHPHLNSIEGHQSSYYHEFKILPQGDVGFLYGGNCTCQCTPTLTFSGDVNPYNGIVGHNGTLQPIKVWKIWPTSPNHLPAPAPVIPRTETELKAIKEMQQYLAVTPDNLRKFNNYYNKAPPLPKPINNFWVLEPTFKPYTVPSLGVQSVTQRAIYNIRTRDEQQNGHLLYIAYGVVGENKYCLGFVQKQHFEFVSVIVSVHQQLLIQLRDIWWRDLSYLCTLMRGIGLYRLCRRWSWDKMSYVQVYRWLPPTQFINWKLTTLKLHLPNGYKSNKRWTSTYYYSFL